MVNTKIEKYTKVLIFSLATLLGVGATILVQKALEPDKRNCIELPPELQILSFDPNNPDTLFIWQDRMGIPHIAMRHNIRKAN